MVESTAMIQTLQHLKQFLHNPDLNQSHLTALLLVLLLFLILLIRKLHKERKFKPIHHYPYAAKNLLTNTEYAFFRKLRTVIPGSYMICPKVRLEDLCYVTDKQNYLRYRGYIRSRHVDFVICDFNCNILLAIELDDASHEDRTARQIDDFKNKLFKKIGIPLYRVPVQENYQKDLDLIIEALEK